MLSHAFSGRDLSGSIKYTDFSERDLSVPSVAMLGELSPRLLRDCPHKRGLRSFRLLSARYSPVRYPFACPQFDRRVPCQSPRPSLVFHVAHAAQASGVGGSMYVWNLVGKLSSSLCECGRRESEREQPDARTADPRDCDADGCEQRYFDITSSTCCLLCLN